MPSEDRKRKKWDAGAMQEAIKLVREKKMGYLKASKLFMVPKATLFRLAKTDMKAEDASQIKLGRRTILPPQLEEELVQYLLQIENSYFGFTRRDVRNMAYQLAVKNNIEHPFLSKTAGKGWFRLFMERHKDQLPHKKPVFNRATGFNKKNVDKFFQSLNFQYETHNFTANRIFNVDETGLRIVQGKVPQVNTYKGKLQAAAAVIASAERDSLVTVVTCMSASGIFVPPMIIFPLKNMSEQLMKGAPTGSIGACHPSGWIQTNLFTKWFEHFLEAVKPTLESPVLLILDGHYSHSRNLDVINLARDNYVNIICLPPHSTHKMQPIMNSFMTPLKEYYREEIRIWLRENQPHVSHFDIAELFGRAYLKCLTSEIAINGFSATGIYPINPKIFNESEFILEEIEADFNRQPTPVTPTEPEPSWMSGAMPSSSIASISNSYPSPPQIVQITEIVNRQEKIETPDIPTLSYKLGLEQYIINNFIIPQKSSQNKNKRSRSRGFKLKKVSSESDLEDDNITSRVFSHLRIPNEDVECLFCSIKFYKLMCGEQRIQCIMCQLWAHSECAGYEKGVYLCDFCK